MAMHGVLRLLIVHFTATALFYRHLFPQAGGSSGRTAAAAPRKLLPRVLVFSVVYGALVYAAAASWNAVWAVPCFLAVFAAARYAAVLVNREWVRLLVFQLILLFALLSLWVYLFEGALPAKGGALLELLSSARFLLILLGLVVLFWPAGYVIGLLTEPFRRQLGDEDMSAGLARAGLWIGCIERVIIYIFVLSNFVTAIAFLVTAKSIFRFGEIGKPGNRKEAEYILIGTLMSFAIAMAVGYIVRYAIGVVR